MATIQELYKLFTASQKISTDSRRIQKNSIFFALKGENFNGNKYASDALKKGASYAIIDEKEYYSSGKTIVVNNVLETLQKLANFHRKHLGIPILGITGTNGKTTTKELISCVLAEKFNTSFTQGNLNNHIGVPLTLLSMTQETEFGVVEMGANHPGEIAELCNIAEPDFGIITNIGKAHLEGFGSFAGVKKTKGELYDYINQNNGTIFYNRDNSILEEMSKNLTRRISYGKEGTGFCGELIQSPPFIHIKAKFPKGILYLNTNLIGDFNYENVLAAACIGNFFEIDPLKIQTALKNYQPNNNRSQLIKKGDLKIIMDAYNANPTSLRASIESFVKNITGDRYIIVGDMLELGDYSEQEHYSILKQISDSKIQNVFIVGKEFIKANKEFGYNSFQNVNELCAYIESNKIKNGNLLIKGSRGIQLEKILEYL